MMIKITDENCNLTPSLNDERFIEALNDLINSDPEMIKKVKNIQRVIKEEEQKKAK